MGKEPKVSISPNCKCRENKIAVIQETEVKAMRDIHFMLLANLLPNYKMSNRDNETIGVDVSSRCSPAKRKTFTNQCP